MDINVYLVWRYIQRISVQIILAELLDAPRQGFHLLLGLHLQVKKVKSNESDWGGIAFGLLSEILCPCCAIWTWAKVKVPIRVGGVSRLAPADWQCGLGTGDIWFLGGRARGGWGWGQRVVKPSAVREQTDGGPNVTQRCTVIYVHSLQGGTSSLTVPEACCNYYQFKVAIFATVFLVSLILCFGLGAGTTRDWLRICRAVPS